MTDKVNKKANQGDIDKALNWAQSNVHIAGSASTSLDMQEQARLMLRAANNREGWSGEAMSLAGSVRELHEEDEEAVQEDPATDPLYGG